MAKTLAERFLELFSGNPDGFGTYDHNKTEKNESKGGKVEIKKSADTQRGPTTEAMWQAHLDGTKPLGVIPIKPSGLCRWGCIDVDKYDLVHSQIVKQLQDLKLPLIVCRTKSGGAHLFLFLTTDESAANMQTTLRGIAAALGFGGSEIFPKQTQILAERGDLGNWLNMPYFSGDRTDRYGVKPTGSAMTMGEFLRAAEELRTTLGAVRLPTAKRPVAGGKAAGADPEGLEDGPPCLQHLTATGFPEGTRNNGLFALGVFCRKKFPDNWKQVLERYNQQFMSPPLSSEEIVEIQKNLERKEYNYRCNDSPINAHCDSVLCRMRRYGVGGGEDYPVISGMSMLDTDPPLWFLDISGERIELNTDQLQNYRMFQKVCMEKLNVCFLSLKMDTWMKTVGIAMESMNKIAAPPEASVGGYFLELLETYCTNRHKAEDMEGILNGKPWHDEEKNRYCFRLSDFMKELERVKFTQWGRNKIASEIARIGGKDFFNIKKQGVRVMWVPATFSAPPTTGLPKGHRDPI